MTELRGLSSKGLKEQIVIDRQNLYKEAVEQLNKDLTKLEDVYQDTIEYQTKTLELLKKTMCNIQKNDSDMLQNCIESSSKIYKRANNLSKSEEISNKFQDIEERIIDNSNFIMDLVEELECIDNKRQND